MAASPVTAGRFGPFHRRCAWKPEEIQQVVSSGQLRGRARRNIYAGDIPAVKAFDGALPKGVVGFEFYTNVEPDPRSAPSQPEWSEGRPGVKILQRNELVAIDVIVTKRQESE